jgi:hypothetical protein
MLTARENEITDLVNEIERLTPLAEAERCADLAGIENHWKGSAGALAEALAKRDRLVEGRKSEIFAAGVAQHQDQLEHREVAAANLAELDAKIATFSEENRRFFEAANNIAQWIRQATAPGPHYRMSDVQTDAYGNVLDISPRDNSRRQVVPDEHWESVKRLRELYKERAIIGQSLATLDSGLRELVAKNPALAFVKLR